MRTYTFEELRVAANQALAQAFLQGRLGERERMRTRPRDPEEVELLRRVLGARLAANPLRWTSDGRLRVPGLTPGLPRQIPDSPPYPAPAQPGA